MRKLAKTNTETDLIMANNCVMSFNVLGWDKCDYTNNLLISFLCDFGQVSMVCVCKWFVMVYYYSLTTHTNILNGLGYCHERSSLVALSENLVRRVDIR